MAEKIDRQLDEQARQFINDSVRNKIAKDKVTISQIFNWFKGDFTKGQSLIEFLNRYAKTKINADADVNHMDYNWTLNEIK